ncbi:hypothetical protein ABC2811 [Shouchella clausii KSM-K16]|uniref:Helix-turn-helix domain-containing protein n=2 Tax=Shouchella clausii TaxID=79880 RepID=Q5WE65_SHOC1|nr:hypothetical protein ABC2811 [Shouchella clausii KSM-K16]
MRRFYIMLSREEAFGRLLAIANVLGDRVYEKGKPSVSSTYSKRLSHKPASTFKIIHEDLMQYAHKFGAEEQHLMDLFGEILAEINIDDFSNESLKEEYLLHRNKQQHSLNNIMSAEEASKKWGLSAGYIKNLAAKGKIQAKKIGKTWIIDKNQPNPKENNAND